jgi:excisionase family DNA binding protein
MSVQTDALERPVQQALERGTRTLQNIFRKLRPKQLGALQTTSNEATFLIEVARLAVEAGPKDAVENDFHQARLRGLARIAELRKIAEPCLETGEVCKLLGVSRETIRKKVDRKQLLALPKGSEDRVFPAFQFKEGEVLPGIKEVLEILSTDSPFVALSFLLSRSPLFRNKTALEALKAGMVKEVIAEAGSYLEHGS